MASSSSSTAVVTTAIDAEYPAYITPSVELILNDGGNPEVIEFDPKYIFDRSLVWDPVTGLPLPPIPPEDPSKPTVFKSRGKRAPSFTPGTTESNPTHPGHIPRPGNKFLLARSDAVARINSLNPPQSERSRLTGSISSAWHALPPERQEYYDNLSKVAKIVHALKYPDYKYQPRTAAQKEADKLLKLQDQAAKKAIRDSQKKGAGRKKGPAGGVRAAATPVAGHPSNSIPVGPMYSTVPHSVAAAALRPPKTKAGPRIVETYAPYKQSTSRRPSGLDLYPPSAFGPERRDEVARARAALKVEDDSDDDDDDDAEDQKASHQQQHQQQYQPDGAILFNPNPAMYSTLPNPATYQHAPYLTGVPGHMDGVLPESQDLSMTFNGGLPDPNAMQPSGLGIRITDESFNAMFPPGNAWPGMTNGVAWSNVQQHPPPPTYQHPSGSQDWSVPPRTQCSRGLEELEGGAGDDGVAGGHPGERGCVGT